MAAETQMLESQWGQASLEVDAIVPTVMLRHHLGHVHIGTPPLEVAREVWAAIGKQRTGKQGVMWTREIRRETLAAALWLHRENRLEYAGVMSGQF